MAKDTLGVVRQYDFSWGPNYTDDIYHLKDQELAESDNVIWDGKITPMPGWFLDTVNGTMAGTTHNITSIYPYSRSDQAPGTMNPVIIVTNDAGRVAAYSGGLPDGWSYVSGGHNAGTNTYWHWTTFNNTLIGLNGQDPPKKFSGPGPDFLVDLGGSPPISQFASHQGPDYLFFAGHGSNPSEIRYCDTADPNTWPVGNSLVIGRNDGEQITGLQRFGESTAVFKTESIWLVSGSSPDDFTINPTPSDLGTASPRSIVLTAAGIFFWSQDGPALFNGYRTTLLSRRLDAILDEVDRIHPRKICAAYYPRRKQVVISYPRRGQTYNDRLLIWDMWPLADGKTPPVFWPMTVGGFSAMARIEVEFDAIARVVAGGGSDGQIAYYDARPIYMSNPVTTFKTTPILSRIRTGALHLGKPDHVQMVRDITLRTKSQPGRITVRYAMDGAQTFTTHTATPYSTDKPGSNVHQIMLEGKGTPTGGFPVGNILQLDVEATGATGFTLHGFEVGVETTSRREPQLNG